jgi:hypothetical protein
VTRLWDKYLPSWRSFKNQPKEKLDPDDEKKLVEEINQWIDGAPGMHPHNEHTVDKLDHVIIARNVLPRKGRWRRFSEEQEERAHEHMKSKAK